MGSSGGTFCASEDVLDLVLDASYTDGYCCNALKLISKICTIYCQLHLTIENFLSEWAEN